ncbi:60S ribosomal protein L32 (nucleomorph) [Lotharella oceanica]|uniref:60S ribosomal protein L32 n=1 Tax=Lotharella oceanica TaxID=641309 RepID=A0A060DGP5_9EUKA|nr:60S ribosomal protein L32 [Lotharella oceanica]
MCNDNTTIHDQMYMYICISIIINIFYCLYVMKKAFIRLNSKRLKRIKKNWRKSRGIDSKIRKKLKGALKIPKIGYGTSKKLLNLNNCGKKIIIINNNNDNKIISNFKPLCNRVLQRNLSCFKKKNLFRDMLDEY